MANESITFCEMYKSSGCEECPNRWVCKNSTVKPEPQGMAKDHGKANLFHSLEIRAKRRAAAVLLDGFPVKGVIGYELKSSGSHTELTLKILVDDLKLGLDQSGDNLRSDTSDRIE